MITALVWKHFKKRSFKSTKLQGGHIASVTKVDIGNKSYVFKIQKHKNNPLGVDAYMLSTLKGVLPVPNLIAFDTINNNDYLLYDFIPGHQAEKIITSANQVVIFEKIAKELRKLNTIPCKGFGTLSSQGIGLSKSWGEHIMCVLSRQLVHCREAHQITHTQVSTVQSLFWNSYDKFAHVPPRLIKTDAALYNFIFINEQLNGILDFEFAMSGDPRYQVATYEVLSGYYPPEYMDVFSKVMKYNKKDRHIISLYALLRTLSSMTVKRKEWATFNRKRFRSILNSFSS